MSDKPNTLTYGDCRTYSLAVFPLPLLVHTPHGLAVLCSITQDGLAEFKTMDGRMFRIHETHLTPAEFDLANDNLKVSKTTVYQLSGTGPIFRTCKKCGATRLAGTGRCKCTAASPPNPLPVRRAGNPSIQAVSRPTWKEIPDASLMFSEFFRRDLESSDEFVRLISPPPNEDMGEQHRRHIREIAIQNAGVSAMNQAHGFALSKAEDYEKRQNITNHRTPFSTFKQQMKAVCDNKLSLVPQSQIDSNIDLNRQRTNMAQLKAAAERFRDEWMKLCSLGMGLRLNGLHQKDRQKWLCISESEMSELDEYISNRFGGLRALEFPAVDMAGIRRPKEGWAKDVIRRYLHGYKTRLRPTTSIS
jgi:hypothetical protein